MWLWCYYVLEIGGFDVWRACLGVLIPFLKGVRAPYYSVVDGGYRFEGGVYVLYAYT